MLAINCRVHLKPLEETLYVEMATRRFMIMIGVLHFINESKFAFSSPEPEEFCGGPETDVRGPETDVRGPEAEALCILCQPPHEMIFVGS